MQTVTTLYIYIRKALRQCYNFVMRKRLIIPAV